MSDAPTEIDPYTIYLEKGTLFEDFELEEGAENKVFTYLKHRVLFIDGDYILLEYSLGKVSASIIAV